MVIDVAAFLVTGALLRRARPRPGSVNATGNPKAVMDVLVSSQVSGDIKALYADWNTKVMKGQLVALIDPEIFQTQVDQATATVRSIHAATITATAQLEKTKSDLSAATASEKNADQLLRNLVSVEIASQDGRK